MKDDVLNGKDENNEDKVSGKFSDDSPQELGKQDFTVGIIWSVGIWFFSFVLFVSYRVDAFFTLNGLFEAVLIMASPFYFVCFAGILLFLKKYSKNFTSPVDIGNLVNVLLATWFFMFVFWLVASILGALESPFYDNQTFQKIYLFVFTFLLLFFSYALVVLGGNLIRCKDYVGGLKVLGGLLVAAGVLFVVGTLLYMLTEMEALYLVCFAFGVCFILAFSIQFLLIMNKALKYGKRNGYTLHLLNEHTLYSNNYVHFMLAIIVIIILSLYCSMAQFSDEEFSYEYYEDDEIFVEDESWRWNEERETSSKDSYYYNMYVLTDTYLNNGIADSIILMRNYRERGVNHLKKEVTVHFDSLGFVTEIREFDVRGNGVFSRIFYFENDGLKMSSSFDYNANTYFSDMFYSKEGNTEKWVRAYSCINEEPSSKTDTISLDYYLIAGNVCVKRSEDISSGYWITAFDKERKIISIEEFDMNKSTSKWEYVLKDGNVLKYSSREEVDKELKVEEYIYDMDKKGNWIRRKLKNEEGKYELSIERLIYYRK